jgi:septum formation inhibitor MinC
MLEKCQILVSLQKKGLKMWEAKLAEEQARGPHFFNGQDLPTELEELHVHVARVEEERAAEARELAVLVIEASNVLVNHKMLPI